VVSAHALTSDLGQTIRNKRSAGKTPSAVNVADPTGELQQRRGAMVKTSVSLLLVRSRGLRLASAAGVR
jgi:hypothetical protein